MRDFWIVNGQFMLYMAVCHAFDAVEGSLLEDYGYSASLSSWTAVTCAATSIGSTILEAIYITDAASYQKTLVIVNIILACSQAVGGICLYFKMHAVGFVLAIGLMGMSTPGWGCSIELGSEVCFPAREATVSSLLEACGNMTGVVAIIFVQRLLDAGVGAGVMLFMSSCALLGSSLMRGLSGRLRRSEAEHDIGSKDDPTPEEELYELSNIMGNGSGDDSDMFTQSKRPCDMDKPNGLAHWSIFHRWRKRIFEKFGVGDASAREHSFVGQDRVKDTI
jgi:hypothetical protein